ncbi:MAG: branched-chain amino acid ABC transporter permease [Roseiflexaceae bacterium]
MIQDQRLPQQEATATLPRLQRSAVPWANPNRLVIGIVVVLAVLLPWVTLRLAGGRFITHLIITFFVWGIVTQCWNLIMGVSGIYSFGQMALYAVGGWTTGTLALHFGWNPLVSIWLAPVAAAVAALIIGLPTLRLRGVYVVLMTLAFHELLRNYVVNGPTIISGGGYGLRDVPKLGFERFGVGWEILLYYYFGLMLFGIATYAIWRILHSPIGMAFRALRDSEEYAVSRGVDRFRFKLLLFAFSAFFTGLAGGFMTHYQGAASPSLLSFGIMINLLAMIVLGGWGTFWGPIVGTAILTILPEVLRSAEAYRNLTLGITLALVAVLAPRGLVPLLSQAVRNLGQRLRKRDASR